MCLNKYYVVWFEMYTQTTQKRAILDLLKIKISAQGWQPS